DDPLGAPAARGLQARGKGRPVGVDIRKEGQQHAFLRPSPLGPVAGPVLEGQQQHAPATRRFPPCGVYSCASLGGMLGGNSGVNAAPSPACTPALNSPVVGSPPEVLMTACGRMYSRTDCIRPPSPLPKSAARPPWAKPAAICRSASWVFSASESVSGRR